MAPEQPFHATTATESVFAGSTRDRTEQSSQDGSAKHTTLTQGTHQQITEHKPAKTTAPERRVKPERSNCSITLHVLYCYITLLYGTLSCVVWQLCWQAVSQLLTVWQTAALAHFWSIYCTLVTLASLCARLSASPPELAMSSLAFRSYWEDKSLPWVQVWCLIVLVAKVKSSYLSFLNKAVNQLPQYYWNKVLYNSKLTVNWPVSHTIPGGT